MKNLKLRKMTAFASALILAASCSMTNVFAKENAKDVKADINEEIYASILKNDSTYDRCDKNKDGVISDEELQNLDYITLDGTIIKNLTSLEELNKLPALNQVIIKDWKDFDISLLKGLQNVRNLSLHNSTLAECSEIIDNIYCIEVRDTKEFDLSRLKPFSDLTVLWVLDTNLTNISALEELELKYLLKGINVDNTEMSKYIKCSDYEIPEGFLCPVTVRPAGSMKGKFTVTDPEVVKFTDNSAKEFTGSADETLENYIFAEKTGETEYQYSDQDGNLICTGNIKVIENKPVDEPLDAENKRSVRIISDTFLAKNRTAYNWAYLLFDDGNLYTYNKDGRGELTFVDENVSNIQNRYSYSVVLYKDGTLKINGHNVTEKYKVVTASDNLEFILCSDGVIRRITRFLIGSDGEFIALENFKGYSPEITKTGDYSLMLEDIADNIKSTRPCPSSPYLVQTKEGKTALIYFEDEDNDGKIEYKLFDLDLNINPVSCVNVTYPSAAGTEWSASSETFYITDDKNDLYMIKFSETESSEGKIKSTESSLIASDVTGCGYLYRRGEGTDQEADIAYTDKDGKAYSCTDQGKEIKAENGFDLFSIKQSDYGKRDTQYSLTSSKTAQGTKVLSGEFISTYTGVSLRTADGTENFSCIDRFASFTHVKESTGTFFDGSDYTILITREDNTLWKYSIESGTFTRIDNDLPAAKQSGPKYGAADLVTMMRYLCGIDDGIDTSWMDINGDGVVNVLDFIRMKKEILRSFQ